MDKLTIFLISMAIVTCGLFAVSLKIFTERLQKKYGRQEENQDGSIHIMMHLNKDSICNSIYDFVSSSEESLVNLGVGADHNDDVSQSFEEVCRRGEQISGIAIARRHE